MVVLARAEEQLRVLRAPGNGKDALFVSLKHFDRRGRKPQVPQLREWGWGGGGRWKDSQCRAASKEYIKMA